MDALTAVLRETRFESVGYRWLQLDAPFSLDFDQHELRGVHALTRGSCDLVVDGTTHELVAGDVVLLPRGDGHVIRSRGSSGCDNARSPDCTILCGAFLVRETEHPVLRALPHVIKIQVAQAPSVGQLVGALGTEAEDGSPGSEIVMARLSDALVVQALRHHAQRGADAGWLGGLSDPHIAPVLGAIHQDPARPWTVGELAEVARLSRATFSARFTARVGQPAMRYVTAVRMQRARTMLRDENVTVAGVAGRVGYGSEVSFASAFKRVTGQNPGHYRRTRGDHAEPSG